MSAGITFWCDIENAYGMCPQQLATTTTDLAAARATAIREGWQFTAAGKALCALYHAKKPAPTRNARRIR